MTNRTLAILKPDCIEKKVHGKYIQHVIDAGLASKA
jgi:nucleoside diphosphate kinase